MAEFGLKLPSYLALTFWAGTVGTLSLADYKFTTHKRALILWWCGLYPVECTGDRITAYGKFSRVMLARHSPKVEETYILTKLILNVLSN